MTFLRHALMGRKQYGDATFVGAFTGGASPVTWPTGTRTGDLALLSKRNSSTPAGWTSLGLLTHGIYAFTRNLDASDLASPLTTNGIGCVYSEPNQIAVKAIGGSQGPPGSAVGELAFAKSPLCAGRVVIIEGPYSGDQPAVGPPFVLRASTTDEVVNWLIYDHLNSAAFVSGTGVSVSWDPVPGTGAGWSMFELTN